MSASHIGLDLFVIFVPKIITFGGSLT